LQHYGNGGQNPPPTGLIELYDMTTEGMSAALGQIAVLRQQLGLTTTAGGH
jgi:hypothetical protein